MQVKNYVVNLIKIQQTSCCMYCMNSQYTLSDPYTTIIKVDNHTKYSIGITVRIFFLLMNDKNESKSTLKRSSL